MEAAACDRPSVTARPGVQSLGILRISGPTCDQPSVAVHPCKAGACGIMGAPGRGDKSLRTMWPGGPAISRMGHLPEVLPGRLPLSLQGKS